MADVEIVITPTSAEYEQLVEDLRKLRDLGGAETNTAAIISAVREKAQELKPIRRAA